MKLKKAVALRAIGAMMSFMILPIAARVLSNKELADFAVYFSFQNVWAVIGTLGVAGAFLKATTEGKGQDDVWLYVGILLSTTISLIGSFICMWMTSWKFDFIPIYGTLVFGSYTYYVAMGMRGRGINVTANALDGTIFRAILFFILTALAILTLNCEVEVVLWLALSGSLLFIFLTVRNDQNIDLKTKISLKDTIKTIKSGAVFLIADLMFLISTEIGFLYFSIFAAESDKVTYALSYKTSMIALLPLSIINGILPTLVTGTSYSSTNRRLRNISLCMAMGGGITLIGAYYWGQVIMRLLYGETFELGSEVILVIHLAGMIGYSMGGAYGMAVLLNGGGGYVALISTTGVIGLLLLMPIGVFIGGIVGAAITSALVTVLPGLFYYFVFKIKVRRHFYG